MNKYLLVLLALVVLSACKSGDKANQMSNENNSEGLKVTNNSCPDKGECTFSVKKNTSFSTSTDGTGAIYPGYKDSSGSVMEFTYQKKGPEGTADGDYSESILFNIPNFGKEAVYEDVELGKLNVMFNKQCFCKGEAGYYPVTKGKLKLYKKPDKSIGFELSFKVDDTSHRITEVKN